MFVRRKLVNGQLRNYAVWTFREGGKVRQRQIYLGWAKSVAARILWLEYQLSQMRPTEEIYRRKIATTVYPSSSLLDRVSGIRRRTAAIQVALDRLNAIGREFGLLPSEVERRQFAEAIRQRDQQFRDSCPIPTRADAA